jgi:hypothetical protein
MRWLTAKRMRRRVLQRKALEKLLQAKICDLELILSSKELFDLRLRREQ